MTPNYLQQFTDLIRLVNAAVIKQQKLITPKIGQVTYLSDMNNSVPWWLEVAPEFDVQTSVSPPI